MEGRIRRRPGRWIGLAVCGVLGASSAWATLTAPALRLDTVEAEGLSDGGAWLRVTGAFPYEAASADSYRFQLFVREVPGDHFACFSSCHAPMEGRDELVENGLTDKEALLLNGAAESSPTARVIEFAPGRIEVQLPEGFPLGEAEAQLFVIYNEVALFSNPMPFRIEEVEE